MIKQLPNAFTLLNLFGGCLAILAILGGAYQTAFILVGLCNVIDFMDGFIARQVGADGPLGRELDSLADTVSFGVVPSMMLAQLLASHFKADVLAWDEHFWRIAPAFVLAMAAAYRLAKFNLDTRQAEEFLGLPVPACTLFVTGLVVIWLRNDFGMAGVVTNPWLIYGLILLLSILMLSELPLFSLKVKKLSWAGNELRVVFLLLCILLILWWGLAALSPIIFFYILLSIFRNIFRAHETQTPNP